MKEVTNGLYDKCLERIQKRMFVLSAIVFVLPKRMMSLTLVPLRGLEMVGSESGGRWLDENIVLREHT